MTSDAGGRTSNYVYIMSDEYAWLPARVVDYITPQSSGDGKIVKDVQVLQANVSIPVYKNEDSIQSGPTSRGKGTATIQTVNLADYPSRSLPLQNVDEEGRLQEVEDMVDLPFLHEVSHSFSTGFFPRCSRTQGDGNTINSFYFYSSIYSKSVFLTCCCC